MAKLAVERVRASKRTGSAIGQVYAWGMVGSILGTFLTGFFLINVVGTKGVILLIATVLALSATLIGSIWHAAWAGIPLGLCVIAFVPSIPGFATAMPKVAAMLNDRGLTWGIREQEGNAELDDYGIAYVDESDYYFIKVTNRPVALGQKRTIVLDNLEHGYFTLGHPEQLDYPYEHIYALVADRVARAKGKAMGKKARRAEPEDPSSAAVPTPSPATSSTSTPAPSPTSPRSIRRSPPRQQGAGPGPGQERRGHHDHPGRRPRLREPEPDQEI